MNKIRKALISVSNKKDLKILVNALSKYKIDIIPLMGGERYTIELTTDNIEWSMEQYKRNREPLTYNILEEE